MFEKMLAKNDTHILKFFLHISPEEQLKRFYDRVANPDKHWKISESDYTERKHWDDYMGAYEEIFNRCSHDHAPWFIIPGNKKWFSRYAISQILVEYMESMNLKFPPPKVDADKIRKDYFGIKNPGDKPRFDKI
jgi:polyphosphate kinase 2 (PPK2 family)